MNTPLNIHLRWIDRWESLSDFPELIVKEMVELNASLRNPFRVRSGVVVAVRAKAVAQLAMSLSLSLSLSPSFSNSLHLFLNGFHWISLFKKLSSYISGLIHEMNGFMVV